LPPNYLQAAKEKSLIGDFEQLIVRESSELHLDSIPKLLLVLANFCDFPNAAIQRIIIIVEGSGTGVVASVSDASESL